MESKKDTTSKDASSSLLKSVKANVLASKVLNIEGKIMPRWYTTYQEPLKDACSTKVSSTTEKDMVVNQSVDKPSFSSVVHGKPHKGTVKIMEMRNEVIVNGATVTLPIEAVDSVNARFVNTLYGYFIGDRLAFPLVENYVKNTWAKYGLKRIQLHEEFFLFQFNTREGTKSVLENGPWLIRRVPLLLNEWTTNTILKKDEIKRVLVWVKMHHVPIVAYSETGLSLISTQIGKPLMLDSYTSNMCLNSWGRSAYTMALIEIAADVELVKSLVITIPLGNKEGHTFATIDIEYEWTPPRFHRSEKKKAKAKKNSKNSMKVSLNKPPLNLQYRRVDKGESSKQKDNVTNDVVNKMESKKDTTSKDASSSLLKSVKANVLASKVLNIEGKIMPRWYTTYQEPLKDACSTKVSSTTEKDMVVNQSVDKPSFSSVVHGKPHKGTVKIMEMRNEVIVNGATVTLPIEAVDSVNARFVNTLYGYFIGDRLAFPLVENYVKNTWAKYGLKRIQLHEEFFLFQFNTREGTKSVLENGPWLIRRVPLLLNEWTTNTILKKDEIKRVLVWVKMHHVPIVAYSETGLSLISTQIGKPLMLDSYTSNMCLNSWGRSAYTMALIEIAADVELVKSLVITIPLGNKEGHTFATIDIEYEWTPPRFHRSEKKKAKAKKNSKNSMKVSLNKPPLNLQYRRVDKGESSKQKDNVTNDVVNKVDVTIIHQDPQVIHTRIWIKADRKEFFCSFVYAFNNYIQRWPLWNGLCLHKNYINNRPWCLLGDFNASIYVEDTSIGSSALDITMRELKSVLSLWKKLDSILANIEFQDCFLGVHAIFKPYRISDHSPSVLSIPSRVKVNPKPFKFFNVSILDKRFKDVKLMYDKGNLHANVVRFCEELDKLQTDLDNDPSNVSIREKEATAVVAFNEALLMEEKFLKQKAKVTIDVVEDASGAVFQNEDVAKAFIQHYEVFLGQPGPDGFTAAFFKDTWDIIGSNVTKAIYVLLKLIFIKLMIQLIGSSYERSLHGHFKGKRGLRQGDPLSPYLFTLIMEVFTLMLHRRVRETSSFTYHRYCLELELINLCFADDLFLFAHGDVNSARIIKEALDEFKDASSLNPSMPKSKAYFCNVLNHTKLAILHVLPFEEDRLSVKYLGVPLVSSRLIFRDCKELIEKVQNRVNDWKNKSLSITGRLQLILFLLCQGSLSRGKAKVAWEVVCLHKKEGGLGVRRLDHFNKALMVSHIWKMSWGWRKLLKLRPLIREFICFGIGDGSKASMWFDMWCSASPLCNVISFRDIARAGFTLDAKLVWESIRPRDHLVPWYELVWFSSCFPQHAFHVWLIMKKRLKTQDVLSSWEVWSRVKHVAGLLGSCSSLDSIISILLPIAKRKSSKSCIGKLVFAAAAYYVWQEPIGSKWVFKNKKDEHGIVTKNNARLVGQGYSQKEGIEYDETFAPMARMEAIRIFLAFDTYMNFIVFQMNVKSAFLNAKLKEKVYVKQPPGFESSKFPDYVCKLDKAFYELKQAPRACAKKQQLVTMSLVEAEYVAAHGCCAIKYIIDPIIPLYEVSLTGLPTRSGPRLFGRTMGVFTEEQSEISYFLMLLGPDYTQDESFGCSPTILSNSNLSKDPSKVIPIELMDFMVAVNNREHSVNPLPFTVKKNKGKSRTGPEAPWSPPQKRKKPKSKKTPTKTKKHTTRWYGIPSTLDEGTHKSHLLTEGKQSNPKDSVGNIQPTDMGLAFTVFDEGAAKTTSLSKGPHGDKDSEGLKPPADMEPQTNPVADPSGTDAKYQADQTQSARLRYRFLTENKGKTSYEVEPDTQTLQLNIFVDVQAFLLSEDEMP
nr:hypothetical protein [Tanacetum cinerariifolium]